MNSRNHCSGCGYSYILRSFVFVLRSIFFNDSVNYIPPFYSISLYLFLLNKLPPHKYLFFFLNEPAPPEIYTFPLHDALPISSVTPWGVRSPLKSRSPTHSACGGSCWSAPSAWALASRRCFGRLGGPCWDASRSRSAGEASRSEEHTSELQSPCNLVCRLLLEK